MAARGLPREVGRCGTEGRGLVQWAGVGAEFLSEPTDSQLYPEPQQSLASRLYPAPHLSLHLSLHAAPAGSRPAVGRKADTGRGRGASR